MPRPKPLVSLHGAVNFDRLVPFDAAVNAPPLAANDILVMRKAAGGDNKTLTIGDITATGSVDIANLIGGANNDMLYRVAGVWTGTGPTGLTYDGSSLNLDGDDLSIEGGGAMDIEGGGGIAIEGGGGIAIEDAGGIEIAGTGNVDVAGGGNVVVSGAGQVLAAFGSAAAPGLSFDTDADTGFYRTAGNRIGTATGGVGQFEFTGPSFEGMVAGAPALMNVDSTGLVPNVLSNRSDVNTGIGSSGLDELSLIAGGVEAMRLDEQAGVITNTSFGDLVVDGSNDIEMGTGQILGADGSSTVPSISFLSDPNTGLGLSSPDFMSLIAGGQQVARCREVGNVQFQLKPQSSFQNSPGEPLLQFHNSALGFYVPSGNIISLAVLGTQQWSFSAASIESHGGGGAGPALLNVGASASVPVIIPNKADPDTGLSRDTVDGLTLIAGGLGCLRVREIGGARAVGFYTTTPIVQQTGVAVTAAAIHAACVNLGLFTA